MNLKLLSSPTPARTRLMLNLLGVMILVVGFGSATAIWRAQDQIDRQTNAGGTNDPGSAEIRGPLSPDDSRRYTHDVEVYYGKTGLLMDKWMRWLEELTRGKPLAKTIAVASLIVASWVFYVATGHRSEQRG
jgi:hypothetical protein